MLRIARRSLVATLALSPLVARAAPLRSEHGWTQDWYQDSFLNLREDLEEAHTAGQRLAMEFTQRGCPYCQDMHNDHLTRPDIEGFIRPRFRIVQLDLHGARMVTDFDGEVLEERALARKWRVTFTPTIVFAPVWQGAAPPRRAGREIEVARMPGLLPKPEFLGFFRFVAERGYSDGTSFRAWWQLRGQG